MSFRTEPFTNCQPCNLPSTPGRLLPECPPEPVASLPAVREHDLNRTVEVQPNKQLAWGSENEECIARVPPFHLRRRCGTVLPQARPVASIHTDECAFRQAISALETSALSPALIGTPTTARYRGADRDEAQNPPLRPGKNVQSNWPSACRLECEIHGDDYYANISS